MNTIPASSNNRFTVMVLLVYAVLSIIGISRHEVWLDEAHHFLLARDSSSLGEMLQHCRYEGHPLLWNLLLFLTTRIAPVVAAMQVLHIIINCFTVCMIYRAPFTRLEKILIIFSYYMLYEYNIISRNYGICMLFLIAALTIYHRSKEQLYTLSVCIFLMANTHLFGLALSGAFCLMYVLSNKSRLKEITATKKLATGLIIFAGFILAVYSIIPPRQYGNMFLSHESSGYFSAERIIKTAGTCLKGLFYLPNYLKYNTANKTVYTSLPGIAQLLLSLIAYIIPIFIFRKSKKALILFISFSVLYSAVYYFLPLVNGIRYFGFYYMVFIACYWLAYTVIKPGARMLVLAILLLQFINGIYAYTKDLLYPYSESKNVATYLNQHIKNEKVLILSPVCRPGISAYTGHKYYDIATGNYESFSRWNINIPADTINYRLQHILNTENNLILISNQQVKDIPHPEKLKALARFDQGFMTGENVWVYRYE